MTEFNTEQASQVLEEGMEEAQQMISDPSKMEDLLSQLETKLKDIPVAGSTLAKVPVMISMVRSYITKEYENVSPKVVASLVSAFVYLIKRKDLIPDNIPLIGHLDDIGVIALALHLSEPELNAYSQWKAEKETK